MSRVLSGNPASKARSGVLTSSQRHRAALWMPLRSAPMPVAHPQFTCSRDGQRFPHVFLSAQPSAGAQDLLGFSRGAALHQGGVQWWALPGVRTPSWDVLAWAPCGCLVGCLAGLSPLPPVTAPPPLQAFLAPLPHLPHSITCAPCDELLNLGLCASWGVGEDQANLRSR